MRPRLFLAAQQELDQVGQTLQRASTPRREPWAPSFGMGVLMAFVGFMLLWLTWPRKPNADPLADARLNNAPGSAAVAVATPAPRAELVRANPNVPRAQLVSLGTPHQSQTTQYGESFWVHMPDSRWIIATAIGRANSFRELPLSGNRIGDARWVGEHCFVWLAPIGQTNPTWIDP